MPTGPPFVCAVIVLIATCTSVSHSANITVADEDGLVAESLPVTRYWLAVSQNGPVVIDSFITFHALLYVEQGDGTLTLATGDYRNGTEYLYSWHTNACVHSAKPSSCQENVTSNHNVTFRRVYSKYDVRRGGEYLMTVTVYEKDIKNQFKKIAVNSTYFTFTDVINGHLVLYQNHSGNGISMETFSTSENITLRTVISDQFINPNYLSVWCITGPRTNISHKSYGLSLSVMLTHRGSYKLYVAVIARVHIVDQTGTEHEVERNTSFIQYFTMKDAISNISLLGSDTYTLGNNLSIDIICAGSPTFHMILNLIDPDNSVIQIIKDVSEVCSFHVSQPYLNTSGDYALNVTIGNEVSLTSDVFHIMVKKGPLPGVGVLIPLFAVLTFIISITLIIYSYIVERRQGPSIESADFSFRSDDNSDHSWIESIRQFIRWTRKLIAGDKDQCHLSMNGSGNDVHTAVKMKTLTANYEAIT